MAIPRPPAVPLLDALGSVAGTGFAVLGALRGGRPIHPDGLVAHARVVLSGALDADGWGCPLLDQPGEHEGLARFSRSVGLPDLLPDVLGLALRLDGPECHEHPHDLLLASARPEPGLRHLPLPAWDALGAFYGSLLPFRVGRGQVLLAVAPSSPGRQARTRKALDEALQAQPVRMRLLAATPTGPWRRVGQVELSRTAGDPQDLPVRFDPVLHPLPGLVPTAAHAAVRRPAYADARAAAPLAATAPAGADGPLR